LLQDSGSFSGVIDVDLLSVIRRWHHRDGLAIREIKRRTGLSRVTIRKYLASDIVEPKYPARKSASKLDPYAEVLSSWLLRESKRNRKRRRNLKQLHRDLIQLGYTGSYDRVAAFARQWRQEQQEAKRTASKNTFVPLQFAPGEAFQFDWSEDWLVIGIGVNIKSHPEDTDFPATSLHAEGAGDATEEEMLRTICLRFLAGLVTWRNLGFAPVRKAWLARAHGLGSPVTVHLDQETLGGVFQALDETGAMILRQDGGERKITAGDVFFSAQ